MRTLYSENKNSNTTIVNGENGTYSSITTTTTEESRTVEAKTYNNADNVIGFNRIVEKNNNKGRRISTESQLYDEDGSYPKEKSKTKKRYNINGKLVEKKSKKTYYSEENGNQIEYTENYYYSYDKDIIEKEKIKKTIDPNRKHLIQQISSKEIYSMDRKLLKRIKTDTDYHTGKKVSTARIISWENDGIKSFYIERTYSNYENHPEKETRKVEKHIKSTNIKRTIKKEFTSKGLPKRTITLEEQFDNYGVRTKSKTNEETFEYSFSNEQKATKEVYETDGNENLLSYEYSIRKPGFSYHINATEDSNKPECYIITLEVPSSKGSEDKTPTKTTKNRNRRKNITIINEDGIRKVSFNVSKKKLNRIDKKVQSMFLKDIFFRMYGKDGELKRPKLKENQPVRRTKIEGHRIDEGPEL